MTDLVAKHSGPVALDAESILLKAIEANVPVESLERLLAMRERIKAEQAREAYYTALSAFQSECPAIRKNKAVKDKHGSVRYVYAPLDDIVAQISPYLKQNGFSFTIDMSFAENMVTATCLLHHIAGHSERSSFSVPIESEAYTNDAQKHGSAQTFAKRYALCNALGIVTSDADDDGQSVGEKATPQDLYKRAKIHVDAVYANYYSIKAIKDGIATGHLEQAAESWEELDNETKQVLWVAPTKGGIFTTEERKVLHSDEFFEIRKKFQEPKTDAPDPA